ncbi:MAG TPA: GlsB/YeaQ/YmgE family stress response membrane protein [Acetobacteraceae bacterium]|nr:GlsB/YeaQ/YmgE family stress response membrane protein [Acetobacteraceae bacterium]
MWLIWAIIIGLIVGALAKLIMPGRDPGGIIVTILLGIGGSLFATWIGQAVGWYRPGQGAGFIASVIGAIIILAIYRAIAGRPAP